jgi:hypothetical protein
MGALVGEKVQGDYALSKADRMTTYDLGSNQSTPQIGTVTGDALDGVTLSIAEADQIKAFWRTAAKFWKDYVPKEKGRVA